MAETMQRMSFIRLVLVIAVFADVGALTLALLLNASGEIQSLPNN